jgi:hypothetical protein
MYGRSSTGRNRVSDDAIARAALAKYPVSGRAGSNSDEAQTSGWIPGVASREIRYVEPSSESVPAATSHPRSVRRGMKRRILPAGKHEDAMAPLASHTM